MRKAADIVTDEQNENRDPFFSDITPTQVLATALAAATVYAIAYFLNLPDSIFVAAIAAILSTVAVSFYKKVMRDGAKKVKTVLPGSSKKRPSSKAEKKDREDDDADIPDLPHSSALSEESSLDDSESNTESSNTDNIANDKASNFVSEEESDSSSSGFDDAIELQYRRKFTRGLFAVCIASGLLTVAIAAAAVNLFKQNENPEPESPAPAAISSSSSSSSSAFSNPSPRVAPSDETDESPVIVLEFNFENPEPPVEEPHESVSEPPLEEHPSSDSMSSFSDSSTSTSASSESNASANSTAQGENVSISGMTNQ